MHAHDHTKQKPPMKVMPNKTTNSWLRENVEYGVVSVIAWSFMYEVVWKLKNGQTYTSWHSKETIEFLPEERELDKKIEVIE